MPVIALGGIKHSGKSCIGTLAASRLNLDFEDLDRLILRALPSGWNLRSWYRQNGQTAFMEMEQKQLRLWLDSNNPADLKILGLGGGSLENPAVFPMLKEENAGCLVILDEEEEVLYKRIMKKGIPPFLNPEDPAGSFHNLYEKRRKTLLNRGDYIIKTTGLGPEEGAAKLEQIIRSRYGG